MKLVERKRRTLAPFLHSLAIFALGIFTGCGSSGSDDTHATPDAAGPGEAEADAPGCDQSAGPLPAGAARSAGYSGKDSDFLALFNVPCSTAADCTAPCVAAGGSMDSCSSSSLCLPDPIADGGSRCIPPAYWLKTSQALSVSDAATGAAEIVLVDTPYHDALLLTNFALSVPDDATVVGIQFDLLRGSEQGETIDSSVQVLRSGSPVGVDRSQPGAWPSPLAPSTYGGQSDTWGASWTPADVRDTGFGLAIAPKFTATKGNDRAHIDSVRATVYYTNRCD